MLAPKRTPRSVIVKLNNAIKQALKQNDVRDRFTASSIGVIGGSPEEFGTYFAAQIKRRRDVAQAVNVHLY